MFFYSPDRKGAHPLAHLKDFTGVLNDDGYAGFNGLYEGGRIVEAACRVGMLPSPSLTDPDVRDSRIRFFTQEVRSRRRICE